MNDDWRRQLPQELGTASHDRVIVSHEGATIFLYAGDREQAGKARTPIEGYAQRQMEEIDVEFRSLAPARPRMASADESRPTARRQASALAG